MARPVTLFTGQWADLPLEVLAEKAASWGFDGLELACWGDHFEVDKALKDNNYCKAKIKMLKKYGLKVWAISTHLVGQAVCDNIDERHKSILPEDVWGDGDPEGVRKRAAKTMIKTAKAACSSPTNVAVPDTAAWLNVSSVAARALNELMISWSISAVISCANAAMISASTSMPCCA